MRRFIDKAREFLDGIIAKKTIATILAAGFIVAVGILATPGPAKAADTGQAASNWLGNTLFGWTDCFKGISDEASKRGVGAVVTGPISCGTNVAVRYTGNAADVVAIPASGKNTVKPAVGVSSGPPVQFGK